MNKRELITSFITYVLIFVFIGVVLIGLMVASDYPFSTEQQGLIEIMVTGLAFLGVILFGAPFVQLIILKGRFFFPGIGKYNLYGWYSFKEDKLGACCALAINAVMFFVSSLTLFALLTDAVSGEKVFI